MVLMNIIRSVYFEKIKPFIDTPVVKVVTGIRRCGKSVMLSQIRDFLVQQGIQENQILSLNFESFTDERVKSFESVTECVKKCAENSGNKKLYRFFDEIQELSG